MEQRALRLEETCHARPRLRAEVESLLAAHDADEEELEPLFRLFDGSEEIPLEETSFDKIGLYRLVEVLGRGGMGTVFRARRDDETFEKEVAIKVINPELATARFLKQFHRERQTLARLEHPGIARLLDGGVTEDGRPYFVMELVQGEPIDTYCERHQLGVPERIRLFQQVLEAVQFAHRNLILHRDLKPQNILVDEAGRPRLLDFGIAEPLSEQLGQGGHSPNSKSVDLKLMTLPYSSPEQILGGELSTASDVYSLGVVLHHLLRGGLPYGEAEHPEQLARAVLTESPLLPSHAAAGGSHSTATVQRLGRILSGDLDSIVLKALRREPDQRYSTAAQFAEDLSRYRDGLPVDAHSRSTFYRLAKFIGRNRWLVLASAFFVATLMALVGFLYSQRADLKRQTLRAETTTEFVTNLIAKADPGRNRGEQITVFEILNQGRLEAEAMHQDPATQATMLRVIGTAYKDLGRYDDAAELLTQALSLYDGGGPQETLEEALTLGELGWVSFERSELEQAERSLRESLRLLERSALAEPKILARHLRRLGRTLEGLNRFEEAEAVYGEAMELLEGSKEEELAHLLRSMAFLERQRSQYVSAEELLLQAIAVFEEIRGTRLDLSFPMFLQDLAIIQRHLGKLDQAETQYLEALRIQREIHHQDHPYIATTLTYLGNLLRRRGSLAEAQARYEEALAIRLATLGDDHPKVANVFSNLGNIFSARREFSQAEKYYRQAVTILEDRQPAMATDLATALLNLGRSLSLSHQPEEAIALQERALGLLKDVYGARHRRVAWALNSLAETARRGAEHRHARALYSEAVAMAREVLGPEHPTVGVFLSNLALNERLAGSLEQADGHLAEALSIFTQAYGDRHVETLKAERSRLLLWLEFGDNQRVETYAPSLLARCEGVEVQERVLAEVEFALLASIARQDRLSEVEGRLGPAYWRLVEVLGTGAYATQLAQEILSALDLEEIIGKG